MLNSPFNTITQNIQRMFQTHTNGQIINVCTNKTERLQIKCKVKVKKKVWMSLKKEACELTELF